MVRFEDGSAWELQYCYWNGTTLSRSATAQFVSSSSGSGLTLTSAATAAMVVDGAEVAPHPSGPSIGWKANVNLATFTAFSIAAPTVTGTATAYTLQTGLISNVPRVGANSATTANAQGGISSTQIVGIVETTVGVGGFEFVCRFAASLIPTGPRLFVGMTTTTIVGVTAEPSTLVANIAAFGKDSTDTNIQLFTNSNSGACTKINTGIPLASSGFYDATIWCDPGSNTVRALLIRYDTGAIWYGSTATDVPANGASMLPMCVGGLSATTGTQFGMLVMSLIVRPGAN